MYALSVADPKGGQGGGQGAQGVRTPPPEIPWKKIMPMEKKRYLLKTSDKWM